MTNYGRLDYSEVSIGNDASGVWQEDVVARMMEDMTAGKVGF